MRKTDSHTFDPFQRIRRTEIVVPEQAHVHVPMDKIGVIPEDLSGRDIPCDLSLLTGPYGKGLHSHIGGTPGHRAFFNRDHIHTLFRQRTGRGQTG